MTFGAASTRWWSERGQHRKDKACLEGYLALLQSRIGMRTMISSIDDNTVSKLVALRRADGVASSTVNRSMTEPLRAILTRAKLWKQVVQEIDWSQHKLKEPEGIVREATAGEERTAFAKLRPDLHPVVKFLLLVGWRRAEACALKWADINFETGFATVVGKGGIVHRRPLPAAAIAVLRGEQGKHPEFVFTYLVRHPNGGRRGDRKPIRPGTLSTAWVRMRDGAGLTLRLHDLRHTTATRVLRATGNLMAASKALGHSKISTTQRYAHMLAEDVRAALDAAAPVVAPVDGVSPEKSPETVQQPAKKALK
ncbi:MAG: site-specific integrase [Rhizobiales bacterium]|nr:site-specific integrase [Hyphomicrobiales bacterium]